MPRPDNLTPRVIRAVVFPDGDLWVAQCLEVDLAISSRLREALPNLVRDQLRGQMELDRQRRRPAFSTLKPAPAVFHALYQESLPWQELRLSRPLRDRLKPRAERGAERVVTLATSQHSPVVLQQA